jgi:hypothetical protein
MNKAQFEFIASIGSTYANKINKPKCEEFFKIILPILESYTDEEFLLLKSQEEDNPGHTVKEKFTIIYLELTKKLKESDESRLIPIKNLFESLTDIEENELSEILFTVMAKPALVLEYIR